MNTNVIKQDEALYLQNKCNAKGSMERIEKMFGPFEDEEIEFYKKALADDGKIIINSFQKEMIFNLFYKYFGDATSLKAISIDEYVKLIIAAKKILEVNGMVILPYVISSKITKLVTRKNVNKKEFTKLESSPFYANIRNKYRNDKIEKYILSIIATILSSEFMIIDHEDSSLNAKRVEIETVPEFLIEEVLLYVLLV